jgi:hypothetical protein
MAKGQASLTVQVNGRALTDKQAKAVLALYLNGTQRGAARSLGISAPVLCRHLRQVEVKAGKTTTLDIELREERWPDDRHTRKDGTPYGRYK